MTYRIRVDLEGTFPPVWRRIEVSSDLHLDEVHDVVQAVFGWTDSHLHRYATEQEHSDQTTYYLCPFDVTEGDQGAPEEQVRLDEALIDPGDRLYYQYDYGDNWQHTLELESVLSGKAGAPRAVCTGGHRDGPAEDCGGVHGYELIVGAAGYLPPVHVEAAVAELGLLDEWVGTGNRESQTLPVLQLRESAQQLGLLRKRRGRLLTTAGGGAVGSDPVALWWHLAERMPLGSRDESERQAGLVLLLAVGARATGGVDALVAEVLAARGWRHEDGTPLRASTGARILWDNVAVLWRIGALTSGRDAGWPGTATPEGVSFTRAALRSWPNSTQY